MWPTPVKKQITLCKKILLTRSTVIENFSFFLWFPIFVGSGIALYFSLLFDIYFIFVLIVLFISGLTTYYLRNNHSIFLSTLALTLVITGFASAILRSHFVDTVMLADSLYDAEIQGRIVSVQPTKRGQRIVLSHITLLNQQADNLPQQVRIHITRPKITLKSGQWVQLTTHLHPVPPPAFPNGFDLQRYLYFQGIGAMGFTFGSPDLLKSDPVFQPFATVRAYYSRILESHDVLDTNQRAVALALLTGHRGTLPNDIHDDIRISGLAHLLAISGLHIGLVAGFTFFSVRLLLSLHPPTALRYPIKKWAAVWAILAAFCFTVMTGANIPTVRAFIMTAVVFGAILIDRRAISLHTLAWAALIILLIYPESLVTASFQLSFAAVSALILFYNRPSISYKPSSQIWRYCVGILGTSIIASIATAPFTAYHFNQFAGYGIFANLGAVPLTAFVVMPMGLLSLLLIPMGLEDVSLTVMGWGIDAILWIAHQSATIPHAEIIVPAISPLAFGVFISSCIAFFLIPYQLRFLASGGFLCAGVLYLLTPQPFLYVDPLKHISALRIGDGTITMSETRKGRYTRKQWAAQWGRSLKTIKHHNTAMPCHAAFGWCQFSDPDTTMRLDLLKQPYAILDSCENATIIISTRYKIPDDCAAPYVYDYMDFQAQGAYAFYKTGNRFKAVSVGEARGNISELTQPSALGH